MEKWKKNPSTVRRASGEASFFLFYIKHAQDLQGFTDCEGFENGMPDHIFRSSFHDSCTL